MFDILQITTLEQNKALQNKLSGCELKLNICNNSHFMRRFYSKRAL